jgi:hypothetical protein
MLEPLAQALDQEAATFAALVVCTVCIHPGTPFRSEEREGARAADAPSKRLQPQLARRPMLLLLRQAGSWRSSSP